MLPDRDDSELLEIVGREPPQHIVIDGVRVEGLGVLPKADGGEPVPDDHRSLIVDVPSHRRLGDIPCRLQTGSHIA